MELSKEEKNYLTELYVLQRYEINDLTIRQITNARGIKVVQLREELEENGFYFEFTGRTKLTKGLLAAIISSCPIVRRKKKKKSKQYVSGNTAPMPLNSLLRKNWQQRDAEIKQKKRNPKAKIIRTPMGGKKK